jgi:hypothetical protein
MSVIMKYVGKTQLILLVKTEHATLACTPILLSVTAIKFISFSCNPRFYTLLIIQKIFKISIFQQFEK